MSNVLIFFVFPVVTIILALVLQKLLKCPILVAATFFAVFLILAYTVFDTTFLINAIIYTILAYIVAYLFELFCSLRRKLNGCCSRFMESINNGNNNVDSRSGNECNCNNSNENSSIGLISENTNSGCNCNCNNESSTQNVVLNAEFIPNSNNNGTTGSFRGCYRRRFF